MKNSCQQLDILEDGRIFAYQKINKKVIKPIFTEQCVQCASVVYNFEVWRRFVTENYT